MNVVEMIGGMIAVHAWINQKRTSLQSCKKSRARQNRLDSVSLEIGISTHKMERVACKLALCARVSMY